MAVNVGDVNFFLGVDTTGLVRAQQRLDAFARTVRQAQARVAQFNKATSRVTPPTESAARAAAKAQRQLDTLRRSLGGSEAAAAKFEQAQRRVDAALKAGIITQKRANDLLRQSKARFDANAVAARSLTTQFERMRATTRGLVASFVALGAALSVREFVRTADDFARLQARLRLVTASTKELVEVQQDLFSIAQQSRNAFGPTADLYIRLARATQKLGVGNQQLLRVVQAVTQSVALSGAEASTAAAGIRQFAQALQAGRLTGDELVSVFENLPELAQAIADGLGKDLAELRKLRPTAEEIVTALLRQADAIDERFGQLPRTIADSVTQFENQLFKVVGTATTLTSTGRTLVNVFDELRLVVADPAFATGVGAIAALFGEIAKVFAGEIRQIGRFIEFIQDPSWQNFVTILQRYPALLGLTAQEAEETAEAFKQAGGGLEQFAGLSNRVTEAQEKLAAQITATRGQLEQEIEQLTLLRNAHLAGAQAVQDVTDFIEAQNVVRELGLKLVEGEGRAIGNLVVAKRDLQREIETLTQARRAETDAAKAAIAAQARELRGEQAQLSRRRDELIRREEGDLDALARTGVAAFRDLVRAGGDFEDTLQRLADRLIDFAAERFVFEPLLETITGKGPGFDRFFGPSTDELTGQVLQKQAQVDILENPDIFGGLQSAITPAETAIKGLGDAGNVAGGVLGNQLASAATKTATETAGQAVQSLTAKAALTNLASAALAAAAALRALAATGGSGGGGFLSALGQSGGKFFNASSSAALPGGGFGAPGAVNPGPGMPVRLQQGGSFFVPGGFGGGDRVGVNMALTPGELVTVTPAHELVGGAPAMAGGGQSILIDARGSEVGVEKRIMSQLAKLNASIEPRVVGKVTQEANAGGSFGKAVGRRR